LTQSLRLAFSKKEIGTGIGSRRSRKSPTLSSNSSASPWSEKMARLRAEHPDAAEVVEQLINRLLDE
jgi:hypothetical protein